MKTEWLGSDFPKGKGGRQYRPCIGVFLLNSAGKVWVGKRDDGSGVSSYEFAWQMPQGGIDKGEDPEKAAFRELYEETSISSVSLIEAAPGWFTYDYPPEVAANSRKGKHCGQAQRWYALRFEGDESEVDILNPPDGHSAEFGDWRWERAENLPGLIVPFKRPVYEAVVQAFSHLTA